MSVVSNELFPEHLKKLKALQDELDENKTNVHTTMGIWLDNALTDDKNIELRKLFIENADNKKYLSKKSQRDITKKVANNLDINIRLKDSNHVDNLDKDYDKTIL